MRLTAYEQEMLDGLHGKTVQKCMKLLVALGTIYGAEDMVEVTNVHSPGVSYRVAGNAGLNYVKEASEDAVFCVPTTLDSVYLRSSQNSQPNSDASDMNSGKERGRVFRIACSDPSPAF